MLLAAHSSPLSGGRIVWECSEIEPGQGELAKYDVAKLTFFLPQGIVIGLCLGLYSEENISLPEGKIVGPPYWQIK